MLTSPEDIFRIIALFTTVFFSYVFTWMAIKIAGRFNAIAGPNEKHVRTHTRPIPLMGGPAFLCAFFPGLIATFLHESTWAGLIPALSVVIMLGLYKDCVQRPLSPLLQLVIQAAAVGFLVSQNIQLVVCSSTIVNCLSTILLGVTLINAINLLDVVDGLAGGISMLICCCCAVLPWADGFTSGASLAALLAAAICGFLMHNYPPARIFMGDTGSYSLGLLLTAFACSLQATKENPLLFTGILFAVPLIELTTTVAIRLLSRRSPFVGDGIHISLLLLNRGWSTKQILYFAYGIVLITNLFVLM